VKHETFVKPRCAKWLNFLYQTMRLLCETVYKRVNLSENHIASYQTSMKLLWNVKPMWNLDAPNNFLYQTTHLLCEIVYKRVNHKSNKYNLVPKFNETIVNMKPVSNLDALKASLLKRGIYFVKLSINDWIISKTNISSYQTSMKLLWNM
jgi:hypothetical protein